MLEERFAQLLQDAERHFSLAKSVMSPEDIEFIREVCRRYRGRYDEKLELGQRIVVLQDRVNALRDALDKYGCQQNYERHSDANPHLYYWRNDAIAQKPWDIATQALKESEDL